VFTAAVKYPRILGAISRYGHARRCRGQAYVALVRHKWHWFCETNTTRSRKK